MRTCSARQVAVLLAIFFVVGLCFVDAGAQRRRKRPRRVTSVPLPSPTPAEPSDPTDPQIVSTADQSSTPTSRTNSARPRSSPTPTPETEQEQLRRTITDLSGQLNKLTDKLNQMETQQRSLVDLERLSRAEQRAETFRAQLRDVLAKAVEVQAQLEQVDFALQPENIERVVGTFGTTHPETAREQRRRQLEAQKSRLQAQYSQLEQSRVRLEGAIVTADGEIEKLQRQIELGNQELNPPPTTTPPPSPTPVEAPPPGE